MGDFEAAVARRLKRLVTSAPPPELARRGVELLRARRELRGSEAATVDTRRTHRRTR